MALTRITPYDLTAESHAEYTLSDWQPYPVNTYSAKTDDNKRHTHIQHNDGAPFPSGSH